MCEDGREGKVNKERENMGELEGKIKKQRRIFHGIWENIYRNAN